MTISPIAAALPTTMTALQPVPAGRPAKPRADAEIEKFVLLEAAASSRNGYQADIGYFSAWFAARDLAAMPASPQTTSR